MKNKKNQWVWLLMFVPILPSLINGSIVNRGSSAADRFYRDNLQDYFNLLAFAGPLLIGVVIVCVRAIKQARQHYHQLEQ